MYSAVQWNWSIQVPILINIQQKVYSLAKSVTSYQIFSLFGERLEGINVLANFTYPKKISDRVQHTNHHQSYWLMNSISVFPLSLHKQMLFFHFMIKQNQHWLFFLNTQKLGYFFLTPRNSDISFLSSQTLQLQSY